MSFYLFPLIWAASGLIPAYLAFLYWGDYYQATRAHLVGILIIGPLVPVMILIDKLFSDGFWSKDVFKGKK